MGRNFFSPDDTGLYMSIVLRPDMSAEASTLITTAAAVAVCRAIEELCPKKALIKWVNDIFVDGRKVCGILTEASLGMESGLSLIHILCGTYNLALVYKALKAMSAPARDTRDCKYRSEKLLGQSEHLIHESAVKVYIRAYTFIYAALLRNKLGCDVCRVFVKTEFFLRCV